MIAHMGYSEIHKGYVLYDLYTHSLFINREVTFREDIFSFTKQKSTTQPLFVDTTPNSGIFTDTSNIIFDVPTRLNESAGTQPPTEALTDFTMENQTSAHISDPQDHIEEETLVQQPIPAMPITENHQNDQPNQQQLSATRKSSRGSQPPVWMKDFVSLNIHEDVPYPLSRYIGYDNLPPKYQAYIATSSTVCEPVAYFEAIKDPRWVKAMNEEIKTLETNHTWDGKKPIGCKWIYKIKYKASGEIERFKARLVVKRYSQHEGIDYQEIFLPIVKMVTVRTILAVAAARKWHIHQMDVYNSFLPGDLHDEIYMDLP